MIRPKNRWMAFAIHLMFSMLVFILLAFFIIFYWFPGSLFTMAGGWDGIKIVATVDLILGPALTLIIYNVSKPSRELKRDLSIIASIQLVCLMGGVLTVFHARPLAVVHVYDTFYVFNAEAYSALGVDIEALEGIPGDYPKLAYVYVGGEGEFLRQHIQDLIEGNRPLQQKVERYQPMPSSPQEAKNLLHGKWDKENNCLRVDIESSYKTGSACFDLAKGRFWNFKETTR